MAFTITAFNHREWKRLGLADYGEFADIVTECNQGEDAFCGYGEWFFIPDEPLPNNDRVIYFGTWGNDHSPAHRATPTPRSSTWTTPRTPPNMPSESRNGRNSPSGMRWLRGKRRSAIPSELLIGDEAREPRPDTYFPINGRRENKQQSA